MSELILSNFALHIALAPDEHQPDEMIIRRAAANVARCKRAHDAGRSAIDCKCLCTKKGPEKSISAGRRRGE